MKRLSKKAARGRLLINVLFLALIATVNHPFLSGQVKTNETVIERATERFESTPLKTVPLGPHIFMFSGDGGNVVAVVDEGSTLIDSGIESRSGELSEAIQKATLRPVTRLVNTHWHFVHTGGNLGADSIAASRWKDNVTNRGCRSHKGVRGEWAVNTYQQMLLPRWFTPV
jgi:hypothetical protein